MKRVLFFFLIVMIFAKSYCQELSDFPRKGSYLYYGQPAFEDNSFLLEEAFNQETGVIQNIFNFYWDSFKSKNINLSFTQEIPLSNVSHQLSYTLSYAQTKDQRGIPVSGFGDMSISYRPMVWGEKKWAMVIPRFTVILPTGSAKDGLGSGALGGQINIAVTKRLSRKVVTHYNMGLTYFYHYDRYEDLNQKIELTDEKNLMFKNLGTSIIWYPTRHSNLMLEYLSNFTSTIEQNGLISHSHQQIINPALRFCIDNGRMQVVPGIGLPLRFENGNYQDTGIFFYLSFEPDYLTFYKAKSQ